MNIELRPKTDPATGLGHQALTNLPLLTPTSAVIGHA